MSNEQNALTPDSTCPTCHGSGVFRDVDEIQVCPCAETLARRDRRLAEQLRQLAASVPPDSLF